MIRGALLAAGCTLLLISAAVRAEVPELRSGLWNWVVSIDGSRPRTVRECVSGARDLHRESMLNVAACATQRYRRDGDEWRFEANCTTTDGGRGAIDGSIDGDLKSWVEVRAQHLFDKPGQVPRLGITTLRGTYLGACGPKAQRRADGRDDG